MNLNKRLRKIDDRIARIDRKLGMLQGRVLFQAFGSTERVEVKIFGFSDNGITPKNLATGEELSAHRFTVMVSRDWIDAYLQQSGYWYVQRNEDNEPIACNKEDESFQDSDTYATLSLAVSQEITLE